MTYVNMLIFTQWKILLYRLFALKAPITFEANTNKLNFLRMKTFWVLATYLVFCIVSVNCVFLSTTEVGFGAKCILKARGCTESRLRSHTPRIDFKPVFQDAIYHYCLNLIDCEEGKVQVCSHVGRSESEYPDPNLRRRLIRQCGIWNIPVKYIQKSGEITGHYTFFRDIKYAKNYSNE